MKKFFGWIFLLGGIGLVVLSIYIKNQVSEGKVKVATAQEQVDQGSKAFSWNPLTEEAGKVVTDSAQSQIDYGRRDIQKYSQIAKWSLYGGIALIILGLFMIVLGRKKTS